MKKFVLIVFYGLFLTACSSKPVSYLPTGTQPIVNVEAPLAEQLDVNAEPLVFKVQNRTAQPLKVTYKLFWYDKEGVTQSRDPNDRSPWLDFWLEPKAKTEVPLTPPTAESVNYRVYLRNAR
ncbi:hypothetical protein A1D29_10385 [Pasteurellaceae bacterium Orientalotternb1]|nr:hypothetical protein A1D29_10385 [Pasteurellaceae bacterium Orientalotternb1]